MESNNRKFKKNDMILVIIIVVIAVVLFVIYSFDNKKDAGNITIKVDGEIQGVYNLSEDQTIEINNGSNILQIRNGEADMLDADCPDKLCVNMKEISKNGETIICLPNKIIVEVESDEESEFDAVIN